MRKKKLHRRIPRLSFLENMIRGAIGKEYVIKHYSYGSIRTRYPDMTKIIASAKQRKCRNLFKEAVVYAKSIMKDPVQVAEWKKRIKKKHRVFNALVKFHMLKSKRKLQADMSMVNRMLNKLSIDNDQFSMQNEEKGINRKPERKCNTESQVKYQYLNVKENTT